MAERVGFEPTNTREDVTGIPVQRLRPLGHLSMQHVDSGRILPAANGGADSSNGRQPRLLRAIAGRTWRWGQRHAGTDRWCVGFRDRKARRHRQARSRTRSGRLRLIERRNPYCIVGIGRGHSRRHSQRRQGRGGGGQCRLAATGGRPVSMEQRATRQRRDGEAEQQHSNGSNAIPGGQPHADCAVGACVARSTESSAARTCGRYCSDSTVNGSRIPPSSSPS